MKLLRLIVPTLAGLLLALSTLVAFARTTPTTVGAPASPPPPSASETNLLPGSNAQDIHADASGKLWITEIESKTVRELDPATRAYTLYTGLTGGARDAQLGPDGHLWWLLSSPQQAVARMDIGTRVVTTWPVTTFAPAALTFDPSGRLWFVDGFLSGLYRFDPTSHQFCDFALPGVVSGPFIKEQDGALWVSDYVSHTLGRMTATTSAYTYWPLNIGGGNAIPTDAALDANGNVWWSDEGLAKIGRLEPSANRLTLFGPPQLFSPQRVAYQGGKIWFTDPYTAGLGYIDPALAVGSDQQVTTPTTTILTPDCDNAGNGTTFVAGLSTGVAAFSPLAITGTVSAGSVYVQVPSTSEPYGLASAGFDLWVTDVGRDKLIRLDLAQRLYLPSLWR